MSNIFDNMNDDTNEEAPRSENGVFSIQFGTESVDVDVRNGMTVRDAFIMNSEYLGFDHERMLTYRDNLNNVLTGDESPVAERIYTASIMHDEKG